MTLVEAHQAAFNELTFCARSENARFDLRLPFTGRAKARGQTSSIPAIQPLVCAHAGESTRGLSARALWIRDANTAILPR